MTLERLTKEQKFRLSQQGEEGDLAGVSCERLRRHRKQKGELQRHADGTHWLRYYVDNMSGTDRVKISEQIADAGASKNEVETAYKNRMAEINRVGPAQIVRIDDVTLGQFFEATYLPWLKKEKKYATWHGVERRWRYMRPIAKKPLKRFKTIDATEFLTKLAKKPLQNGSGRLTGKFGLNRNTLNECRSLLSAIFRHAINTRGTGWEDRENPIHACKVMVTPREVIEREPYTDDEIMAMIEAIPSADGKLFMALCACIGMRPSEAAAVQWADFDATHVTISRSAAYGHLSNDTKSEKGKGRVLLIEPVKSLLAALRAERTKDERDDFIFARAGGLPINHTYFVGNHIRPYARKACPRFSGVYNGRHSTGSELKRLTGKSLSTADVLRNTVTTAEKAYIHSNTADGDAGLMMREVKLAEAAMRLKQQQA